MISIVTLSLQRREHTERLVDELYQRTRLRFELVVVSQASSAGDVDWLSAMARARPNLKLIFNERNVGTAAGRNQGLRATHGSYVVFVDNDVTVTDGWLEPLVDTAQRDTSIGSVGAYPDATGPSPVLPPLPRRAPPGRRSVGNRAEV